MIKTLWVFPKLLDCVGEAIALPHAILWTMELDKLIYEGAKIAR
jgi:hypothetical protein